MHDYWESRSFDSTDLCRQTDASAFSLLSRLGIAFLPRRNVFNFVAAVTLHGKGEFGLGAQLVI